MRSLFGFLLLFASFTLQATTYTGSVLLDDSGIVSNSGDMWGQNIQAGDSVVLTGSTIGNDYWINHDPYMWIAIYVLSSGDRLGNTYLSLFNDGALVDAGSDLGGLSQYVHIGQGIGGLVPDTIFDSFILTYELTSSSVGNNVLDANYFLDPAGLNAGVEYVAGAVPVPAAIWLFGSGLLGLIGYSRRTST